MMWLIMLLCMLVLTGFPVWSYWIQHERMRRYQRRRVEKILERLNH